MDHDVRNIIILFSVLAVITFIAGIVAGWLVGQLYERLWWMDGAATGTPRRAGGCNFRVMLDDDFTARYSTQANTWKPVESADATFPDAADNVPGQENGLTRARSAGRPTAGRSLLLFSRARLVVG